MDAQAHLNFLKNMRSQLDAQIAECEQAVKREFDAAQIPLPISDEGWIAYDGKGMPVSEETEVFVRWKDGNESCRGPAWFWGGWGRFGNAVSIIAYRIAGERT